MNPEKSLAEVFSSKSEGLGGGLVGEDERGE